MAVIALKKGKAIVKKMGNAKTISALHGIDRHALETEATASLVVLEILETMFISMLDELVLLAILELMAMAMLILKTIFVLEDEEKPWKFSDGAIYHTPYRGE